jgi:hypothetical protein
MNKSISACKASKFDRLSLTKMGYLNFDKDVLVRMQENLMYFEEDATRLIKMNAIY